MSRLSSLQGLLATRTPRERRLIALATAVVALGAALWLADWSGRERERLARQLPQAQAQLAKMQADAAELAQLARLPAQAPVPLATLAQSAAAAAASRGLALDVTADGNALVVSGSGTFDALVDWLASVHAQQRLRVSRITMQVTDGAVRLDAALTPAVTE